MRGTSRGGGPVAQPTFAGVGVSLLVNAMFFTGVFTLFRDEIIAWQDPRGHSVAPCAPLSLDRLLARRFDPAVSQAM